MSFEFKTKVYAGRLKDRNKLIHSSSGGAFVALTDYFLENGDAVVCTVYNYLNNSAEFKLILTENERNEAIGSKYMQSNVGQIFKHAEDWLKENSTKKLLFVGMGCQGEAFRKFCSIKGLTDQVFIVDIICHGTPSPKLWREYAHSLEEKKKGKITYLTFKDKRNGWKSPMAYVTISEHEVPINDYVRVFYNRCALRPSCYECKYTTIERKTDMTIGDFWHIEKTIPDFYDTMGNSLFLIHTEKGERLFELIKNDLNYRISDTKQCWQTHLERPTDRSELRNQFWSDYQGKGVQFVMKKYGKAPLKTKIKEEIVKLMSIGGGTKTKFQ